MTSSIYYLITLGLIIAISVGFVYVFYKQTYRFLTFEVNWLFFLHFISVCVIIFLFKPHFSNLLDAIQQVLNGTSINDVSLAIPLQNDRILIVNNDNFNNIERTSIAIFALFIPLMFALYMNYFKDIFSGLDKITTLKNADKEPVLDAAQYNNIVSKYVVLQSKFNAYSFWLRVLFYCSFIILVILIFLPMCLYALENDSLKYVCLNVLKCFSYINILTFITLLLTYLLLIIPAYRHLYNSTIFIKPKT